MSEKLRILRIALGGMMTERCLVHWSKQETHSSNHKLTTHATTPYTTTGDRTRTLIMRLPRRRQPGAEKEEDTKAMAK